MMSHRCHRIGRLRSREEPPLLVRPRRTGAGRCTVAAALLAATMIATPGIAADQFGLGKGGTRLTRPDPPSSTTGFGSNTGFGPSTGFGSSGSGQTSGGSSDGTKCVSYWCAATGTAADCNTGCPHPQQPVSPGGSAAPADRGGGGGGMSAADAASAAVRDGNAAFGQRNWFAAAKHYRRALALRPDRNAYVSLGAALTNAREFDGALEAYNAAARVGGWDADLRARVRKATAGRLVRQGTDLVIPRPADAAAKFREALALAGEDREARYFLGWALSRADRLEEAAAVYRRYLELYPGNRDVQWQLQSIESRLVARRLDALFDAKRWGEAEALLRRMLADRPNDATVHRNLATALRAQGKLADALAELDAVVRLMPQNASARADREALGTYLAIEKARAGYDARRIDEANADLRAAVAASPAARDRARALGANLWRRGDLDGAAAVFETLVALDANDRAAREALADVGALKASRSAGALFDQKRWAEAAEQYRRAAQLAPRNRTHAFNLAVALQNQDRLDEAIVEYERALRIDPNYARAREELARVRRRADIVAARAAFQRQAWPEAEARLRAAMARTPGIAVDHYNLGVALERQGRLDEARAQYAAALRLADDPDVRRRLEALREQQESVGGQVRAGVGRAMNAIGQLVGIEGEEAPTKTGNAEAAIGILKRGFDQPGAGGDAVSIALRGLGASGGPAAAPAGRAMEGDLQGKREAVDRELAALKEQRTRLGPQDQDEKRKIDQKISDKLNQQQAHEVLRRARTPPPPPPAAPPPPPAGVLGKLVEGAKVVVQEAATTIKKALVEREGPVIYE